MLETKTIEWLTARLGKEEGYNAVPYFDTKGKLTGGVGHNLDDNPLTQRQLMALFETFYNYEKRGSRDGLRYFWERILLSDIDKCDKQLAWSDFTYKDIHTGVAFVCVAYGNLNEARKAVLVDMCFHMGYRNLCGFKNMWVALYNGRYEIADKEGMDSNWGREFESRARPLMNILRTGEFDG